MSLRVGVVGAGMIPFGRYPDRTPADLGAEALLLALDDCGLAVGEVEALYVGSTFNAASMIAQQVLKSALKWGPIQGPSSPNSSWSIDSKMRLSCSDGNARGSQATQSLVCCN